MPDHKITLHFQAKFPDDLVVRIRKDAEAREQAQALVTAVEGLDSEGRATHCGCCGLRLDICSHEDCFLTVVQGAGRIEFRLPEDDEEDE